MSRRLITQRQENLDMKKRQRGECRETAAAKGGISELSGRRIEQGVFWGPNLFCLLGEWNADFRPKTVY